MICENCGADVKEGSKFCPRCGKTIISSDEGFDKETENTGESSEIVESIIKSKINYYTSQFELIKNGGKGKINWASFFFGFIHAGYRNVWKEWIAAVKIPLIAEVVLMIAAGISIFVHPVAGMIFYALETVVAIWLLIAQFLFERKFNQVYMKHVQEKAAGKIEKPDPSVGRAILSYVIMMIAYAVVMAILSAVMVAGINYQMQQEFNDYLEESYDEDNTDDINWDTSEESVIGEDWEEPDESSSEESFNAAEYDWEYYYDCQGEETSAGLYIFDQDESGIMFSIGVEDSEGNILVDLRDCTAYWSDNQTAICEDDGMGDMLLLVFNEDGSITLLEETNYTGMSGVYQRTEDY